MLWHEKIKQTFFSSQVLYVHRSNIERIWYSCIIFGNEQISCFKNTFYNLLLLLIVSLNIGGKHANSLTNIFVLWLDLDKFCDEGHFKLSLYSYDNFSVFIKTILLWNFWKVKLVYNMTLQEHTHILFSIDVSQRCQSGISKICK